MDHIHFLHSSVNFHPAGGAGNQRLLCCRSWFLTPLRGTWLPVPDKSVMADVFLMQGPTGKPGLPGVPGADGPPVSPSSKSLKGPGSHLFGGQYGHPQPQPSPLIPCANLCAQHDRWSTRHTLYFENTFKCACTCGSSHPSWLSGGDTLF